jgi:ABC-2 type transport system ATP-binding protein
MLPTGASVADLPLPTGLATRTRGDFVEFHVAEPTTVLHTLTAWAVGRGEVLAGLTVVRPSLEDVYLELIGEAGR